MVLTIAINIQNMKMLRSKSVEGQGVPQVFPNNIDSRRICDNQNCCKREFVEKKPHN